MFKKVTKSIAKQMDPKGELIPVSSILDEEHFRPFCLVRRQGKTIFHPNPGYRRTEYNLYDLLSESIQVTLAHDVDGKIEGKLQIPINSANTEVYGSTCWSKHRSIKLEKKHIPVAKLESLKAERKINMKHSFIQQLKKKHQDLFVVSESIQALEETKFEETSKMEGNFMAQLYAKFSTEGIRGFRQSITIPKGCTIAFRTTQLFIGDGSWDIYHFPEDDEQTFVSDGFLSRRLGALEKEVNAKYQIFTKLSVHLQNIFLNSFKAVMRNRNLFQELSQKMEAVLYETGNCELETESPGLKDLLLSLRGSPSPLLLGLAEGINYTLYALEELTEDHLLLLLESLEEKIVSQQLKLVKSILEHDIENTERCFSVAAGLLSFSREEGRELTTVMLEMSGVKIEKNGWAECKQDAFTSLAALYASLYALDLLSRSD
uniref:Gasdermin A n=1 Tax=Nothoprocta perdicaria TaxID=30464 RepID=A0A8C6ZDG8_NOTPE